MSVSSLSEKVLIKNPNGSILADEGGNARGINSIDLQQKRVLANQVASGRTCAILGGENNKSEGYYSVVVGGLDNSASSTGFYRAIVGGQSNSIVNASYSSILGGLLNTVTSSYGVILGGCQNTASANKSAVICGYSNIAAGNNSIVLNGAYNSSIGFYSLTHGVNNTANGVFSSAIGRDALTSSHGQHARSSGGFSNVLGSAQSSLFMLSGATADATPTLLYPDGGSSTYIAIDVKRFMAFTLTLLAVKTNGGDAAQFTRKGIISNVGGTTALVGSVQTLGTDIVSGGAGTWTVAVTANNTTDRIDVTVTGQAATNIRWCARLDTVEILIP